MCMQYGEWKEELAVLSDSVKSVPADGMPGGSGTGKPTETIAIQRMDLDDKIQTVEDTVRQAAEEDLQKFLLYSVANNVPYDYLEADLHKIPPCSRNTFYARRRRFFWLLSKKIK